MAIRCVKRSLWDVLYRVNQPIASISRPIARGGNARSASVGPKACTKPPLSDDFEGSAARRGWLAVIGVKAKLQLGAL